MCSSAANVSVSTAAATGHHMLKIEGYSRLKKMHGNGKYFESSQFVVAGHAWRIRCYLNGAREEDAGFISLRLNRSDDNDNAAAAAAAAVVVHAEVRFALVYHHGKLLRWPPYAGSYTCAYHKGTTVGFPQFITAEDLERSGFLKDDCFAVRCDVTVVEKPVVKEEVVQAQDLERMGMVCKCKGRLCKRHHLRLAESAAALKEAFVRFCRSIYG